MIHIETKRLIMRDHVPGDLETHHSLFSHPKTMHYLQDIMTHSLLESAENLTASMENLDSPKRVYYFLRMEEKLTGQHIGEIGYTVDTFTALGKLVGVGYFIRPEFWGKGYTAEGLKELLRFAFEENGVYRVSCGCLKENSASERVMIKCGLIKEAEHKEYQWHEDRLKDRLEYRLLRREWENMQ